MSDSPFKMTGHTLPGPNQASPLKETFTKTDKQKYLIKNYDKHKDDANYRKALDKAFNSKGVSFKKGKVYIPQ